ncbi:Anti-silencing protein, ASF1-like protein [Ancylostoma caninum]|uniref:Anti-silencing protein, ASF1-like protein n=1 Tax=Ancylostoma caninum TaxID=29170 RepID=A0A368GIW6_ANCCA|nr:Anti-silencing protein, ASF1-like protein [Ancylostoma caninum]
MASRVNVCSVNILDNPSTFTAQFKLEITFEVFEYLPNDLEWELVYVGSAKSSSYDQVLDSALVGPVPEGRHKFVFAVDAPDPSKIPVQDLVGVTVLLLRCKYNGQEFINLGWFVSNDYEDPELKENPPAKPIIEKIVENLARLV